MLEVLSRLNVVLANTGGVNTIRRRDMGLVIDPMFVSDTLSKDLQWQVSEEYTRSDYQAIIFQLERTTGAKRIKNTVVSGWTSKKLDEEMFEEILVQEAMPVGNAREKVAQVLEKIQKACDAFMPRHTVLKKRMPNFWWNAEIEELRKVCLKARRHSQHSRNRSESEELHNQYKKARKELQAAISRSKTEYFKRLLKEANFHPWGGAYKALMATIKGKHSPAIINPDLLRDIISTLFPQVSSASNLTTIQIDPGEILEVITKEVSEAAKKIAKNKAPGLDAIPNKAQWLSKQFQGGSLKHLRSASFSLKSGGNKSLC